MPRILKAKRCPHCGAPLEQPPQRVCTSCGGSLQQRYLQAGCFSSSPVLFALVGAGALFAWLMG